MFTNFEICLILQGLVRGSHHIHSEFIVHRDLHPKNVFVDEVYGRVYIGDFGFALHLKSEKCPRKDFIIPKSSSLLRYKGSTEGYYQEIGGMGMYLPPEIIDNFHDDKIMHLDFCKSDLFSIGMIGYFLLFVNSTPLFEKEEVEKCFKRITPFGPNENGTPRLEKRRQERFEKIEGTDEGLMQLVEGLLKVNLRERFGYDETFQKIGNLVEKFRNN